MNGLKYIIVEHMGCIVPVIFANVIEHNWIAQAFPNKKLHISAGFCRLSKDVDDDWRVVCWGESTSLKLKSRPEDIDIIRKELERGLTPY